MGIITTEDILGYKAYAEYESEDIMYEELMKWDGNTPLEVLQSKQYLYYEGQMLDVLFSTLTLTMRKMQESGVESAEDFNLNGYNWFIKSKDGSATFSGDLKDGKLPMINLCDVPVDNYIDFMAHYLVDATEYRLRNKGNDEHSYRVESRFFQVGLANKRESKGVYFKKYDRTSEEVSQRIEDEYVTKMSRLYSEEDIKDGRAKIRRHINKGVR